MQTFLKKSADKILAVILAAVITMGVIPFIAGNADVEAAAIKEIKEVVLSGITLPKEGKKPTIEGITTNGAAAGYSVLQMCWITQNGTSEYTGTFNPGETYRLYACFVPSDGSYTFPSDVKHDIKFKANGVEYISNDSYQAGTACLWGDEDMLNISVYYKVPGIDCDVYFYGNGGSGSMNTMHVEQNNYLTLPECGFNPPSGKEFDKWMIGSDYYLPGDKVKITMATTVNATWTDIKTFSIKYNMKGHGTQVATVTGIPRNSLISEYLPQLDTYEGWLFKGWYKDSACQQRVSSDDRITGNMTLYACWYKEITSVVINGITLPKEGEMPTVEGITTNGSEAGFTVEEPCWIAENDSHEYTGVFKAGVTYRLMFTLRPSSPSYSFPSYVKRGIKTVINGVEYISSDSYLAGTACLWGDASELYISVYYKVPYTGWQEIDGKWYFFDQDGIELKGWQQINKEWYYFDSEGVRQSGWQKISGSWYYFDVDGKMLKDWQQIEGVWYYFGGNGVMRTGWQQIGTAWYYFTGSGVMQTSWQQIGGVWYYFTGSGVMLTGWQKIGEVWYYFESSGAMVTGWKEINGVYYFFKSNGSMAANEYCGGYWLDASGAWTYKYKASWKKDAKGWWYGDDSGWYAKNGAWKIDGKEYNFNASGYCTNP